MSRPRLWPVLSPADLGHRPPGTVRLGGRVVSDDPLVVADALGATRIARGDDVVRREELRVGELVVVEGFWTGADLLDPRLVQRSPGAEPRGDGEVGRFIQAGVGRRLRHRHELLKAARSWFDDRGFLEVETPVRVAAPNLDPHVVPVRAHGGWLITSPEHHMKRLLAGGLPRIVQFARCTRRDEVGPWHEPEFVMVEWYRAFADLEAMMSDTEQLIRHLAARAALLAGLGAPELEINQGFERWTVREAFQRLAGVDDAVALAAADEQRYFELLVSVVEPGLAHLGHPVFLYRYPATQAALARLADDDPTVAERFELYVAGVELCNGYDELTDPVEQRRRFELESAKLRAAGSEAPLDRPFLAALEEGMPPSSGNALGFDRLVALVTGAAGIADVVAFPAPRRV